MLNTIDEIIHHYRTALKGAESKAKSTKDRAYGGVIRAQKGKLWETIAHSLILISWQELGGKKSRIEINSSKIQIPINTIYAQKNNHIPRIGNFNYDLSVDKHIFIDKKFVIGIECKAYTENAMLKRILTDFTFLTLLYKNLICFLFQGESQLGGDYCDHPVNNNDCYGSEPTHTIISQFPIDLHICTVLQGNRKVDEPIHKPEFYKDIDEERLIVIKDKFKQILASYV